MYQDLENKVALITGARQGIGKAIALKLSERGARVIVTDINEEECRSVLREIEGQGGKGMALKLDVTDKENIKKAIETVVSEFKRIDILVNNAGVCFMEDIEGEDSSVSEKTIDVNLRGVIDLTYALVPIMVKQRYGKIVNISSIASIVSWPQIYTYSATKGAIVSFTKNLAGEFAGKGINVNAIAPGAIETPMLDSLIKKLGMTREQLCQVTPKGRVGQPEDIANAVAFLSSDESDFITGQLITVDGGYIIK
jgi:3-oxoacyl-[acyl-carrier protein] reductase